MENVMQTLEKGLLEDEKIVNFNGPEDDEDSFDDDFEIDEMDSIGDFNDDFDDDDF
ncbi:hypothetical protein ACFSQ3_12350 [Sphingobacterium corticis]|uniref:Uncharacterized protein n=1 Tax=Sphingobacterium corticis TaxID=1812823 RepID=A0ABW5NM84_9SPHI